MFKKIIVLLIFVAIGFSAFADTDFYAEDMYIGSSVDFGLGGPYPTDNEGLDSIFANPASFKSAEPGFEFFDMTTHVMGPVIEIAGLASSAIKDGQEITEMLAAPEMQDILNGLYTGISLSGPLAFGYVGKGLGIGLFNSTDFLVQETGPISLSINITEEVMLTAGYSFRIPLSKDEKHTLDLGIMAKGALNGSVMIEKSFLELPGMFTSIGPDLILGQPFEFSKILSADAGALYSFDEKLSLGVNFQDFYSVVFKDTYSTGINGFQGNEVPVSEIGMIPFKLNAGFEWDPHFPKIGDVFDLRFMAAYDDVLDFMFYSSEAESWMLHVKGGAELTLFNFLDIRAGVAEGLLNAGVGFDLKYFRIDAAVFGTERSSMPNMNPVYNMVLSFTI